MSEEIEIKLLQEIEELKREIKELKGEESENKKSYSFSQITMQTLSELVNLKKSYTNEIFNEWFNNNLIIKDEEIAFLKALLNEEKNFIKEYSEEDLKVNFIAPIIKRVNFKSIEFEFRDFYEFALTYESEKFIFKGNVDFVVSKGLDRAKLPYFFIQEFKKSEDYSNPRPQLLAELISAVELNNFTFMKGAYIIGSIWNFVILERIEKNSYKYYLSDNFDSSKIEDLKAIYKNLLFVKYEILKKGL